MWAGDAVADDGSNKTNNHRAGAAWRGPPGAKASAHRRPNKDDNQEERNV